MFPRSLEPDSQAFCKKAMEKDLMLVPGDIFGWLYTMIAILFERFKEYFFICFINAKIRSIIADIRYGSLHEGSGTVLSDGTGNLWTDFDDLVSFYAIWMHGEIAMEKDLMLVPGDIFGCPGHFRIAYCVPTERVEKALPIFQELAEEYL